MNKLSFAEFLAVLDSRYGWRPRRQGAPTKTGGRARTSGIPWPGKRIARARRGGA